MLGVFNPVHNPCGCGYCFSREGSSLTPPVKIDLFERTLVVRLPNTFQVLSWGPFSPGQTQTRCLFNHQLDEKDSPSMREFIFLDNPFLSGKFFEPSLYLPGFLPGSRRDRKNPNRLGPSPPPSYRYAWLLLHPPFFL